MVLVRFMNDQFKLPSFQACMAPESSRTSRANEMALNSAPWCTEYGSDESRALQAAECQTAS